MDYQEFDQQLREDVHQIQMVAATHPTEETQVGRVQYIAMAAAFCLMRRMGPMAAGYYLHQIAERIEAHGRGDVH